MSMTLMNGESNRQSTPDSMDTRLAHRVCRHADPTEKRYAEALLYLQRRKQQHLAEQQATQTIEES